MASEGDRTMTILSILKLALVTVALAALLLALRIWHCATTDPTDDYDDSEAW